ncbi:TIGR01212 family radical SAM protein [Desulfogranum marinum]|jgi:radical SAM protein (TIGR01212 family)|uniref:TIGR01212 family radical SAM protein n=1 Tax=Desulfogranum marinum TaxID=453220 RepID=UPI0029C5FCC9|nr:TIGR01212 family radical SAM protein [Desulfogranum marinum]
MKAPRVRSFSYHCRQKYGVAVGKIPLDVGITCPNRLRGGCIYCRPASFTPSCLRSEDDIPTQIERGKQHLLKGRFRYYFGYFQQETVTALAQKKLLPLLADVLEDPSCLGLVLSTRPDHLPEELVESLALLIEQSKKDCLIELGLQSVHAKSLELLNRNHSLDDFFGAVDRVKRYDRLQVGAHLIFGIPGESRAEMVQTVECVAGLHLDALKLHHLQVIKDTVLHTMYLQNRFALFSLQEYMDFLLQIIPLIPANVTLHRLWSTSHPSLLVAPKWHVLVGELSRILQRRLEENGVYQGCKVNNEQVATGYSPLNPNLG